MSDGCFKVLAEDNIEVSKYKIRQCLKDAGLKCYRKQKKHDLISDHIKGRYEFSRKFENCDCQVWERVVWSDESSFDVLSFSWIEYYWSKKLTPLNQKKYKENKKVRRRICNGVGLYYTPWCWRTSKDWWYSRFKEIH